MTVTKSEDFKGALALVVASGEPCLIDVHVDANIRPPGTAPGPSRRFPTRNRYSAPSTFQGIDETN